ncbi:hypothetical protein [Zophobihabitans entericus]|uniref:Lipoprotein n=1 Tax=Zophobihabitans entericus TaxID=1635327 RepID=A0A6G9ICY6_9GAMM|nr:hypothetical protein [Zophobihabitans entericus]QIQ22098.1 hypothetical protein IPMB12_10610 [Zophobihabitans entericus]
MKYSNNFMRYSNFQYYISTSVFILVSFLLSACTTNLIVTPRELPIGILGEPYYAEIDIKGGSGHISGGSFSYSIHPLDSGIELIPDYSIPTSYNHLIIRGIPGKLENIRITISAETINTSFGNSSQILDKTYIIKIEESK